MLTHCPQILTSLRTSVASAAGTVPPGPVKLTHLPVLDDIAARHYRSEQAPALSLSGRYMPLLYKLVSGLVSAPHRLTVLVIDLEGRFDATRLACSEVDARHIYVQRPEQPAPEARTEHLRAIISQADAFMLYSDAARPSAHRRWWGTLVAGGGGPGDVVTGWRGWLRVDRKHVNPFPIGSSAEEAMENRDRRQKVVDAAGWQAESPWGGFVFHDEEEGQEKDDAVPLPSLHCEVNQL